MNMNLFGKDKEAPAVDVGYINKETLPSIFPVTRKITATAYPFNGKYYFKTKELAMLLDIKQPFDFTQKLRKQFGPDCVLSDKDTEGFRDDKKDKRSTYISAETFKEYLESNLSDQIADKSLRDNALIAVKRYLDVS